MVNPAFVFLPLYLYPYNASSWSAVTTAVAANPSLRFQVVVAPNLSNIYPDVNYQNAISGLNSFSNVQTLGYVPTSWANRAQTAVLGDVSDYAAWSNFTAANIAVQGIFFDEAPSLANTATLSYMKTISTYARTALGPGRGYITFNPGVVVDPLFYDMADSVIIFENSWAEFNTTFLSTMSWALLQKSTVVVHSFLGSDAMQANLINNITDANVTGLLITTSDGYTNTSSLWPQFCEELADKNNGGDLPSGDVIPTSLKATPVLKTVPKAPAR
ncbi:Spherulation-specific family 4 [Hyaloscypha variabilis]